MIKRIAIAVFAYQRPSHLKRVMMSIENSKIGNDIYLFIDGPKNKKDKLNQKYIRLQSENFKNKNKFKIIQRSKNLGLAKSILYGVTILSKKYDAVIVLEDDTVPYKDFFPYMIYCLKNFSKENQIGAICSYQFSDFTNFKNNKFILLNNFITWGWGIESKKWIQFINFKNNKLKKLSLKKTIYKKVINKTSFKKNIWSLDFIKYNYFKKKKFIFPTNSLIKNIGFDGTGTNSKYSDKLIVKNEKKKISFKKRYLIDLKLQKKQQKKLNNLINLFY